MNENYAGKKGKSIRDDSSVYPLLIAVKMTKYSGVRRTVAASKFSQVEGEIAAVRRVGLAPF
jgi:hypothetical protein